MLNTTRPATKARRRSCPRAKPSLLRPTRPPRSRRFAKCPNASPPAPAARPDESVMTELFHRIRGLRLARYIAASAVALGADMATFLVLLDLGVFAAAASAAGYCLGILVHWLVSSRKVFGDTLAASGAAR